MHPSQLLQMARTLLFVPGTRPERFSKAIAAGADAIVLDLEDSVPIAEKPFARESIAAALPGLQSQEVPLVIRVNTPSSEEGQADLRWLRTLGTAPAGVMVSKAETAEGLAQVLAAAGTSALLPLIETAAGLESLSMIARAPGVQRLVVGHIDFMADTGIVCSADERELDPLRFAVAIQSRLGALAAPIDGVTTAINDDQRLSSDVGRAIRFGFAGKLCIHPRQVAAVHACMAPTAQELAWARRVVDADAASGGAAVQLDGRMVDRPVVLQARRTLARADRVTGK